LTERVKHFRRHGYNRSETVAVHSNKVYTAYHLFYICCETWHIRNDDVGLRSEVASNNSFHKIFNARWTENVEALLFFAHVYQYHILLGTLKLRDMKLRERTQRHKNAGLEIVRHESAAQSCRGGNCETWNQREEQEYGKPLTAEYWDFTHVYDMHSI